MGNRDISYCYRKRSIRSANGSTIWRSFRKIEQFFLKNLVWSFQTENNIIIGHDPIAGGEEYITFSQRLLQFLHRKGIFYWV